MTRLVSKMLLALCVCSCCLGYAYAMDDMKSKSDDAGYAPDMYGYMPDDVAMNQATVAYWWAHGYAATYGNMPKDFAEMTSHGMPYRNFKSPHTGDAINPDDGSLDFDGDMTYSVDGGDAMIKVKTSKGEMMIPGSYTASSDIAVQFGPCCCPDLCGECFDPTICDCMDWGCKCSDAQAGCAVVAWMMWKSFEAHEKLFGQRPASDKAFFASGLSPVGADWNQFNSTMTIDWFYRTHDLTDMDRGRGDGCCKYLVKAYVHCCANQCGCCCEKPQCASGCGDCNKCGCDKCGNKSKCGSCNKCESKCGSCNKCENKCNKCNKCENKCGCNKCENKCNSCNKCSSNKCGCSKCGGH